MDVRVGFAEFDALAFPFDVRVGFAEFDTNGFPFDVRVGWAEFDLNAPTDTATAPQAPINGGALPGPGGGFERRGRGNWITSAPGGMGSRPGLPVAAPAASVDEDDEEVIMLLLLNIAAHELN